MPEQKREATGSLSKSERQKLQNLYTRGFAAYGSVRNLSKASKLPESTVRKFLHSKTSYTRFTQATRKFKRTRAFARFKNEIWCLDLAFVDKLASENNGVKYLLVRQDIFDRTVDARGIRKKGAKETLDAFKKMITKKNRPKKLWVDAGTEFAGDFKKFCKNEGITIYSTMSEKKAAFAERTIRSLKNIIYRYMEDYGFKYIHKLAQFVSTLNSRSNRSIKMKPKDVKNSDFLSILYNKPLMHYKKPRFSVGDSVRISKQDLPFRKGYKPQFTLEVFQIVGVASKKPPTYTIKDEQDEIIRGKFYEQELIKVI